MLTSGDGNTQYYMTLNGSAVVTFTELTDRDLQGTATTGRPSSRFVYDFWYWSDTPKTPTNVYYPNGHIEQ